MGLTTKDDAPVPSAEVDLRGPMSTLLQGESPCHLELSAVEAEGESESVKIRSRLDDPN